MSVSKVCAACGKQFEVPVWRAEKAKTCSRQCNGVITSQKYEERRAKHVCKWCGSLFSSPQCHASWRVYCSQACKTAAQVGVPFTESAKPGTTTSHSAGYLLERSNDHPFSVNGSVLQHRLVMERWMRDVCPDHLFLIEIGGVKYLRRDIVAHHKNEVKDDNVRENLMACTRAAHLDIHAGRPVMRGSVWPESSDEIASVDRRVERSCNKCGKVISKTLSDVLRGGGKFCSKKCFNLERKEGPHPDQIERFCVTCGSRFITWPSLIKTGRGKFCSNACRHKSRIGRNPREVISYGP